MTVLPATGTFYDPWHQNYFTGTELEVVAINGMLNSSDPISMIRAPHGDGSWLNSDYSLGYVNFSAGGFNSVLFNDSAFKFARHRHRRRIRYQYACYLERRSGTRASVRLAFSAGPTSSPVKKLKQ